MGGSCGTPPELASGGGGTAKLKLKWFRCGCGSRALRLPEPDEGLAERTAPPDGE